jgi:ribosomal protein L32
VSITAADITIPTTLDLNAAPQCLPSPEETRKRRAQQARHQTSACPHCGEWAIVETVTVNRPGLPGVVQTLSRCQRNPRWREERCPLTILHEGWAPDPPDDTADDQAPAESLREALREEHNERPQAKAVAEEEESMPETRPLRERTQAAPEIVQRPVPPALRVSVLDLAQRAVEGASIRATMRAILALSPERQDLLRRLLDDVEAA